MNKKFKGAIIEGFGELIIIFVAIKLGIKGIEYFLNHIFTIIWSVGWLGLVQ